MGRFAFIVALLAAAPAMAQSDCHVGLTSGYVFGRSQHIPDGGVPFTDTFDVQGRAIGVKLGCLKARDRWRYGFGADFTDSSASGQSQMRDPNQNFTSETSLDWFSTVRLVSGYEFASGWTTYLTGGIAVASISMRMCRISPAFCTAQHTQTFWGLTGGGGVQYRLGRRWSASFEYLYFGFEDKPFSTSGTFVIGDHDVSVNPEAHLARLGLNFHF